MAKAISDELAARIVKATLIDDHKSVSQLISTLNPSVIDTINNGDGLFLLHLCVLHRSFNMAKTLLRYSANVHVKDGRQGWTPLDWSIVLDRTKFTLLFVPRVEQKFTITRRQEKDR
jgi:ankyrin repeat protein